jgi:SCP-2 sterol transfer family
VARYLSAEWFEEVAAERPAPPPTGAQDDTRDLLLEQVVRGTPDGEVRYRVAVRAGAAHIEAQPHRPANGTTPGQSDPAPPDLIITCDWPTAIALAQGELASQTALMEGRLRIKGNLARVTGRAGDLIGLDPVPESVRRRTTY